MIKKYLSFAICCLLLVTANSSLISAQAKTGNDAACVEKIKAVVKRAADKDKRLKAKMLNGTKLNGKISQAGEETFTLTDSKTGQSSTVAYRDVSEVKRTDLSKGDIIALGTVIGAAVIVVGYFTAICRNEGTC